MRSALISPNEYRAFAAQCSRWAARAKREEHKNMMLKMANHWMQTAQELDRTRTYPSLLPETPFVSRSSYDDAHQE